MKCRFITPEEVAEMLGMKGPTINSWRRNGIGPPYTKFGSPGDRGLVRYEIEDVERWLSEMKSASREPTE